VVTKFKNKCAILADLWLNYRNDEQFTEFIEYNDLGLPLAYAIDASIVEKTPLAKTFIEETFDLLVTSLGHKKDKGWITLDKML
jgi:hypothetical protein